MSDEAFVRKVVATTIAKGHVLFEDYPGLGKTLLAKTFARLTDCSFNRIQFTPDLLPADILGTKVWRQRKEEFELIKGPIFTNIVLADEINRAPAKTQSALLEGMEERQVSIEGDTHQLEDPFIVLATQNPLEMEGTYPLPTSQVDRFMVKLRAGYASSLQNENLILKRRIEWQRDDPTPNIEPVLSREEFTALQDMAEGIHVDEDVVDYISRVVRETRNHPKVDVGASPRGGLALLKLSRALAVMEGRDFVTPDDVKSFLSAALSHRVTLTVEHVLEEREEEIVEEVARRVEPPITLE